MHVHIKFEEGAFNDECTSNWFKRCSGQKSYFQLKDTEHSSVALVRKEEQVSDLKELGADKVVVHDLEEDFQVLLKA